MYRLLIAILLATPIFACKDKKGEDSPETNPIAETKEELVAPVEKDAPISAAPAPVALVGATAYFLEDGFLVMVNQKGERTKLVPTSQESCDLDERSKTIWLRTPDAASKLDVYDIPTQALHTVIPSMPNTRKFRTLNPLVVQFESDEKQEFKTGVTPILEVKSTSKIGSGVVAMGTDGWSQDKIRKLADDRAAASKLVMELTLENAELLSAIAKRRVENNSLTLVKKNTPPEGALSFLPMPCPVKGDSFCELVDAGHDHWLIHTSECGDGCYDNYLLYDSSKKEHVEIKTGKRAKTQFNEDYDEEFYTEGDMFADFLTTKGSVSTAFDKSSILISNGSWYSTAETRLITNSKGAVCGLLSGPTKELEAAGTLAK